MNKTIFLVMAIFASTMAFAQAGNTPAIALNAAEAYVAGQVSIQPSGSILQAGDSFVDELGQAHVRYQHLYKGIPVFESEAIVHIDLATSAVIGFTDALLPFAAIEVRPGVGPSEARGKALQHFRAAPADCLVVHDDLERVAGKVSVKSGGGAAGHNGIRSVSQCLGTEHFPRVRVGIGRPADRSQVASFVLEAFTPEESQALRTT